LKAGNVCRGEAARRVRKWEKENEDRANGLSSDADVLQRCRQFNLLFGDFVNPQISHGGWIAIAIDARCGDPLPALANEDETFNAQKHI
jgi:hypothetical protein